VASIAYGAFNCGNATDSGSNCTATCTWAAGTDGAPTSKCAAGQWSNVTGSCVIPQQEPTTYQTITTSFKVETAGGCSAQMTNAVQTGLAQDVTQALDAVSSSTAVSVDVNQCTVRPLPVLGCNLSDITDILNQRCACWHQRPI
jgi:hypothetical protein